MKVYIVGAGPGDPELITLKGANLLKQADIIIYAGSLVSKRVLEECKKDALILDSANMNLDEVGKVYKNNIDKKGVIVRLHTGDPSVYGAIQEQMDLLESLSIYYEVIPGVSSFQASSAQLKNQLTLPGVSQTVILSRISGRTKVPELEKLENLAKSKATMVLFLSIDKTVDVQKKLIPSYGKECPFAVVYRASWPDQKIVRGKLVNLDKVVKEEGITRQALIFIGEVLEPEYELSKLYDSTFSHGFREAAK